MSRKVRQSTPRRSAQICHAIAGKGNKANPLDGVGKKLSADEIRQWIVNPDGDGGESQVDQEAADAGQVRQAAGRPTSTRSSRTCQSEVAAAVNRREALVRHPLAIAGALITTASAVRVHRAGDRGVRGHVRQPVRRPRRLHRHPGVLRARAAAHSAGHVAAARASCERDPDAPAGLAGLRLPPRRVRRTRSSITRSPPSTSSSCCSPATAACTGWNRRASAARSCHTPDAPAVHRLAGRRRTRRIACVKCHIGEGAGGVRARQAGRRPAARSRRDQQFPRPIPPGAEMPPGAQAVTCIGCHQPARVGRRSNPRDSRVCRRRGEHRDDDRAADAPRRGRRRRGRSIHWHADPSSPHRVRGDRRSTRDYSRTSR